MHIFFNRAFNPIHAYLLLAIVGSFSWMLSVLVPFCRRQVAIEDVSRLTPLDGLRGILCFSVMIHHAGFTFHFIDTGRWDPPGTAFYSLLGGTGVAFFFCITAFLFWTKILRSSGLLEAWPFYRARIFRLVPLYLFICIVALCLTFHTLNWSSKHTYTLLSRMATMGIQPWEANSAPIVRVNAGVTWSLQYEWAFYLFLPALAMMVVGKMPIRMLFVIAGLFCISTDNRLYFFFPGIIAAHMAQNHSIVRLLRSYYFSLFVIIALIAFPYVAPGFTPWRELFLTSFVFIPIACGNSLCGLLNLKGLRLMGIVSYSVYLLHGTSLYLANDILYRFKHSGSNGNLLYWFVVDVLAVITMIVSVCTYRWIELPFIKLEKHLRESTMNQIALKAD